MTCQTRICIGSGAEQDKARHSPYLDRPLRSREQVEAKIADYAKQVGELQALWNQTRGPHLGIDLADQTEACRPCFWAKGCPCPQRCDAAQLCVAAARNALIHAEPAPLTPYGEMAVYEPPDPELRPFWAWLRRLWRR